jgi:hypothetical protein
MERHTQVHITTVQYTLVEHDRVRTGVEVLERMLDQGLPGTPFRIRCDVEEEGLRIRRARSYPLCG